MIDQKNVGKGVADFFSWLWQKVARGVDSAANGIKYVVLSIGDILLNAARSASRKVRDFFSWINQNIVEPCRQAFLPKNPVSNTPDGINLTIRKRLEEADFDDGDLDQILTFTDQIITFADETRALVVEFKSERIAKQQHDPLACIQPN